MAANFSSGVPYKILSITPGTPPVGVNVILPGFQNVSVNAPVQDWMITKASDTTYVLSVVGYPFTGVNGVNVIATIDSGQNEEWQITASEVQNTYTIARATQPQFGWTVPNNLADGNNVSIKPLTAPQFAPTQLFLIQPSN